MFSKDDPQGRLSHMYAIFVEMQDIMLSMWNRTIQIKLISPDLTSGL